MITCITYGDRKYEKAGRLNLESAMLHGADKVIQYGPRDLPLSFKLKNWRVYYGRSGWRMRWRGAGFWIWKSYIIKETLKELNEGDYLFYSDAGSVYVNDLEPILETFDNEKLDVMVFTLLHIEKEYTKRDAFILLDADSAEFVESKQRIGGYIIVKKSKAAESFIDEWHEACRDYRIITDSINRMGTTNYPGVIATRHDQSSLSLMAKKHGIKEYRDPSQFGNDYSMWPHDIIERSKYPQIWYSTRNRNITTMEEFKRAIPDCNIV